MNPSLTYIGGFLLSQLKFLLGIFKSLGVLVQLILSSLQLLLQSYQIVLKLRRVSVRGQFQRWSAGRERERAQARERHTHRERHTQQERTGQDRVERERRKVMGAHACQNQITLVAASSAVSSFSSAVWNSSNTLSLSSSVTRNFFSNSLISSSNYTCI